MQVLKFGGSSIANAINIQQTIGIVQQALAKGRAIMVCSAFASVTDKLLKIGSQAASGNIQYKDVLNELNAIHLSVVTQLFNEEAREAVWNETKQRLEELELYCYGIFILNELSPKSKDYLLSFGELLSTKIIAAKFGELGVDYTWVDSRTIIETNELFGAAQVNIEATNKKVAAFLANNTHRLYIFPGFIAANTKGETTTLGRGGSDYSASTLAVASDASLLEIWTDVGGMMTADPRLVKSAKTIPHISYREALELSHFGAKVLFPPTIRPVVKKGIPVWIKNTFNPSEHGTLIQNEPPINNSNVRGLSNSNNIALISLEGSGMIGVPGFSYRMFGALAHANINIILITQASSVHTMLIAIEEDAAQKAKQAVDETFVYEISLGTIEPLRVETGYSIITLVGDDMKQQSGTSGRMFNTLGCNDINIRAIAQGSSEKNISIIVSSDDAELAINAIHNEFF